MVVIKNLLKDFKKPSDVEFKAIEQNEFRGEFQAEPFERGFGTTIGNSLRRAMLSSLWGAAVVAVKFEGTMHEFSTIEGVVEDTTEIILNLKKVRIKKMSMDNKTITISKKGPCKISAGDLNIDADIEIKNKDQHLVQVSDDVEFSMTVEIRYGRGFVPSEDFKESIADVDAIAVDANFSPIRRVNLSVENTRVGQRTDYEKIILDVQTDGTVAPEDAISQAAKILKEHYSVFINFDDSIVQEDFPDDEEKQELVKTLEKPIDVLELSVRSQNCVKAIDIEVIGDLVSRTEADILRTRNFGKKSLNEIKEKLEKYGLSLGMKRLPLYNRVNSTEGEEE